MEQDPFLRISTEQERDIEFDALLGALDDLHTEFVGFSETRRQDEEIMAAVQGVYAAGAEYSNNDFAKTIQIFSEFEQRLGAMQSLCSHDHMMSLTFGVEEKNQRPPEDDDDDEEIDPKTGKKRKAKRWYTKT